ncbi:t-box domain-containing protein [Ditylenchus destructor]|nr:t-box domain-containing protein [Ditylenchus destructor]
MSNPMPQLPSPFVNYQEISPQLGNNQLYYPNMFNADSNIGFPTSAKVNMYGLGDKAEFVDPNRSKLVTPPIKKESEVSAKQVTDTNSDTSGISVELKNRDLWKKFHRITNEMVVTKPGRKMFPKVELDIKGLDPKANYVIVITMKPVDNYRYKFQGGGWSPAGQDDIPETSSTVAHHDGPYASGDFWMSNTVSFDRVKLTNKPNVEGGSQISLCSMHKYQPVITIHKMFSDPAKLMPIFTFAPVETQFIAVTAYQSESIIKLKVQHNPFAKGFREGSIRKRSLSTSPDSEVSPPAKMSLQSTSFPDPRLPSPYIQNHPPAFSLPYQFAPYYNALYSNAIATAQPVGTVQPTTSDNASTQRPYDPTSTLAVATAGFSSAGPFVPPFTSPPMPSGQITAGLHPNPYWNSMLLYRQMFN